jgi:hypothetical protein
MPLETALEFHASSVSPCNNSNVLMSEKSSNEPSPSTRVPRISFDTPLWVMSCRKGNKVNLLMHESTNT